MALLKMSTPKLFIRQVVLFLLCGAVSVSSFALSGDVIYSPTTGDLITRARTSPALTPELNQTYQRTMRAAMTRAAAARAAMGLIRGLQIVSTIGVLVTLASDIQGIWSKDADGKNVLTAPMPSSSQTGRYKLQIYLDNSSYNPSGSSESAACSDAVGHDFVGTKVLSSSITTVNGTDYCGGYATADNRGLLWGVKINYLPSSSTSIVQRPVTDDELVETIKPDTRLIPILKQLDSAGSPVQFPDPEVEDMPQPIVINPKTVLNPDGSKTITETTLEPYRTAPDAPVFWRKKDTVTQVSKPAADGSTTSTTETTTTDNAQQAAPEKIKVCGLPDTPPCIIDETGMPTKIDVDSSMKKTPTEVQKDIDDIAKNPSSIFPKFPTLNWAFALPTGCAQIPTPAFAPALTSIDVCQFTPMFHDIMGVVWVLGGLFGAISLFMKSALSD